MGLNLKKYDTAEKANAGVWKEIVAPDGVSVVGSLLLAGQDSKIMKQHQHKLAQKKKRKANLSTVEEEQQVYETYGACILDWKGFEDENGKTPKYSLDIAIETLKEYPWVLEQVVAFVGDRTNFL